MKENKKRVCIYVNSDVVDMAKSFSNKTGVSVSRIYENAVRLYLANNKGGYKD